MSNLEGKKKGNELDIQNSTLPSPISLISQMKTLNVPGEQFRGKEKRKS